MADFFGNNRRSSDRDGYDRRSDYDRRDDYDRRGDYDRTGNNFDRRYSSGGGGYFDRGDDTRRNVSRSTEERLNRALPPIGQPVRTQPTGQFVPPQQPAPQYAATPPQNPALQSVPIGNVVLYSPKNYGDVQSLIDHLRMHEPAIVEFAGIGDEDGQRILDFLSGAIYALGGSMQRINGTIFLLTPYGVSISAGGDIAKSIEERRNRR